MYNGKSTFTNEPLTQDGYTSLACATIHARRFSDKYLTFWYVREVKANEFEAYAHSNDNHTVSCFYCGKEWTAD